MVRNGGCNMTVVTAHSILLWVGNSNKAVIGASTSEKNKNISRLIWYELRLSPSHKLHNEMCMSKHSHKR